VRLAIEVDGLIQRFGRAVPDSVALLDRVSELRDRAHASGGRLDVALTRLEPRNGGALEADIDALGLGAKLRALDAELVELPDASSLAAPGGRAMLLAGRWASARAALAGGMVAYLVSDRRESDPRQLEIEEAARVIAESLQLAVPRPVSPEARRGTLSARGLAALRRDPHADWFSLGRVQIVYAEEPDVVASLIGAGGAIFARQAQLGEFGLAWPGEDTELGSLLFDQDGFRFGRLGKGAIGWPAVRRAWIARAPSAASDAELSQLPSLAGRLPPDWAAAPAALLPDEAGFDAQFARSLAVPGGRFDDGRIVVFVGDGEAAAALAAIAQSFGRRPERCAALFCCTDMPAEAAVHAILWEQERSQLAAIVAVAPTDAARSETVVDRALASEGS
jgi:hypothetical protein